MFDIAITDNRGRPVGGQFQKVTEKEILPFIQRTHIQESRNFLKLVQKQDGFTDDPEIFVDGSNSKPIEKVKPLGNIVYIDRERSLGPLIQQAFDALLRISPVKTGQYRDHNWVFFNNSSSPVAKNRYELIKWLENKELKQGDVISFVNVVPYARRLEYLGVKGGNQPTVGQVAELAVNTRKRIPTLVPRGAYITVRSRFLDIFNNFAQVSKVEFKPYTINLPQFSSNTFKTEGRGYGRPYLYPTLNVKIQFGKGGFGNVQ